MKLPTVDSCCCCFNLIAGGKFLGWFGIFYGIILIVRGLLNDPLVTLPAIGVIVMSAFWLYGIHKARPSYLLPKMILLFIAICIILIGFIVGNLVLLYFALFSNEPAPHIQKGIKLKTFVFFLGFAAAFFTYIWVIKYSVYKAVKQIAERQKVVYSGTEVTV